MVHLNIHPDILRKAADKELSPLTCRDVRCMAGESLKPIGELLDRSGERQPPELSQPTAMQRRTKAKAT